MKKIKAILYAIAKLIKLAINQEKVMTEFEKVFTTSKSLADICIESYQNEHKYVIDILDLRIENRKLKYKVKRLENKIKRISNEKR